MEETVPQRHRRSSLCERTTDGYNKLLMFGVLI